jgi:hypothetical protein
LLGDDASDGGSVVAVASTASAVVIGLRVGAVVCAAYCTSNDDANDKDDDDDDRLDPPSRAVPWHLRDKVPATTILRLLFLAGEGHGLGAVATGIRSSVLA